jgi:hypothetical protein
LLFATYFGCKQNLYFGVLSIKVGETFYIYTKVFCNRSLLAVDGKVIFSLLFLETSPDSAARKKSRFFCRVKWSLLTVFLKQTPPFKGENGPTAIAGAFGTARNGAHPKLLGRRRRLHAGARLN